MNPYTTVIPPAILAEHLDDPRWVIIDCRFDLKDVQAGEREYARGHIPGAHYAHLDRDLSGVRTGANGRHPLPEPDAAAPRFGRFGVEPGVQVVAYDQDTGMFAARCWWLLRYLGHDAVAVLDGGYARWTSEGRPTTSDVPLEAPGDFQASPRPAMLVDAAEVARVVHEGTARLIDARAPERYRGDVEPLDAVAGHIPGAVNHFFKHNLDDRHRFLDPAALKSRLSAALAGAPPEQSIAYCGSGVTACHNLLALEIAGLHGAKLYGGSWSEWSADPERPFERSTPGGS